MISRITAKLNFRFGIGIKNMTAAMYSSLPKESKIAVNGVNINYVQVGTGPKPLLCLPGAVGTIWSDFKPQIENLNREKFTVVAWDPPGYGNSRPPKREFPLDFFHRDADWALKLMKALGFAKFSLLGWSDGGITGIILTGKYPENVDKLVIWGANAYIIEEEVKAIESKSTMDQMHVLKQVLEKTREYNVNMRDINKWSERMRAPLIKTYGEQEFQEMWSSWVDAYHAFYKNNNGDICKEYVSKITCPTFVLHGRKDPLVAAEHPDYLAKNIKNCRLHVFEEGKHNIHLKYEADFNKMVEDFLSK